MKPHDLYRIASIAFRVFFVVFLMMFALPTSSLGLRTISPFLGKKSILRFIGIPDAATLLALGFIIASPFVIHCLVRDSLLVNSVVHPSIKPQTWRAFLWNIAIAVVILDAIVFYNGVAEQIMWGETPSRWPAITLSLAYVTLFPVFAFIDLYLSLKSRS